MREHFLIIDTDTGPMKTFVCAPKDTGNRRAVILYMDVFGLREELYDLARKFCDIGYLVLIPDLFHRLPISTFPPANRKGEPLPDGAADANRATTLAKSLADTESLKGALKRGTDGFEAQQFAVVGFCMGGRHALAAAAAFPQSVKAGMSVHGGKLVKDSRASPHLLIEKLRVPFHFAFAKEDPTCPEAHKALLRIAAGNAQVPVTFSDHEAHHGWTFPDRWSYDPVSRRQVLQHAGNMFASAFGPQPTPA